MHKKIRTCVIGAGSMGSNHCRILSKISNLVGICDTDLTRAKSAAHQFNSVAFTSLSAMIDSQKPQAVVVAVNTQYHAAIALELIKNNIPLLVEKPIATTIIDAKKIVSAARRKNVFLMVGMVERYNPTIVKIQQDIAKNIFGDIYQMVALRVGISPPVMHPRSVDLDLSVHDVDIINYLLGEHPVSVRKIGNKHLEGSELDTCSLTLGYKKMTATVISNWVSPVKIRRLYIFGEKISAEINMLNQVIYYYSKIPLKAIAKGNYYVSFQELGAYSRQISFKKSEPLVEELKVFLSRIENGYDGAFCENGLSALTVLQKAKK